MPDQQPDRSTVAPLRQAESDLNEAALRGPVTLSADAAFALAELLHVIDRDVAKMPPGLYQTAVGVARPIIVKTDQERSDA